MVELAWGEPRCDTAVLMTRAFRFFAFTSDSGAGLRA
jgi:hypothetical protein